MKKLVLYIGMLFLTATVTDAQSKNKKGPKNNSAESSATKKQSPGILPGEESTILNNTTSNKALKPPPDSLGIADPTIRALDANAKGANIKLSPSGLIGVPRGTYGFANGKLVLYSTGATSTGTVTGMGSVGTGTSPGAVGSFGSAMGVNGKNPYAGPGAYSTRIPFPWRPTIDSAKNNNTGIK